MGKTYILGPFVTDNFLDDVAFVGESMRAAGWTGRITNSHALLIVIPVIPVIPSAFLGLVVCLLDLFGVVEGNRFAGRFVI